MQRQRVLNQQAVWQIMKIAAIILAVAVVYLPTLRAGFVWDDEQLVTGNPLLRTGSGLAELWLGGRTADYFPITNTLFWIEWQVFGNNPIGYHIVNVLLHAIDALLVWLVLGRLKIPGAWLAGLIFAIHPVNVESVAWISELKNVLSMFFLLLALWCFFDAQTGRFLPARTAYICSICLFLLALLAKSQAVCLPIILLLCAWWRSGGLNSAAFKREAIRSWPFFIAAIALGLTTVWFQNRGIGAEQIVTGSLLRRLANAGGSFWWYAGKVVLPLRLMAIYPPWRFDAPEPTEWLPLIGLIALMAVLWFCRRSVAGAVFFALACFIAALLPVLGFFRMAYLRSGTLVADHFLYFADVALIGLGAAGVALVWNRRQKNANIAITALIVMGTVALGSESFARAVVFRNEESLWADTLSKNADAWQAHIRLGQLLFNRQQYAAALPHLQRAVELKPELADNYNLLGLDYCRLERFQEGIAEYRKALQLKEGNAAHKKSSIATIRTNLGNALTISANNLSSGANAISTEAMQQYDEAIVQYQKALELEPGHPAIHRNLGMLLARLGRYDEAEAHLRRTLELEPNEPVAREVLSEIEASRR